MGQRLVVTIKDGERERMKIYYHWSAYTKSTFGELIELWNIIKPLKDAGKTTNEILLGIIHGLEGHEDPVMEKLYAQSEFSKDRTTHGGIGYFNSKHNPLDEDKLPNEELAYIQHLYPGEKFAEHPDRNYGLIYMSRDGMKDVQGWSEGNATINLEDDTYEDEVYWSYPDKRSFLESNEDENEESFNALPLYDGDAEHLFYGKCEDLETNYDLLCKALGSGWRFRDVNNAVFEEIG